VGTPVKDVCRKPGVSKQTFYRWKRSVASMGVAEVRKLKQLEEENRKLKQLVADFRYASNAVPVNDPNHADVKSAMDSAVVEISKIANAHGLKGVFE